MERKQGEQYDPAEIAIAELQVHIALEAIPTFTRNQQVGEGNNSRHPERTLIERSQAASGIVEQPLQQAKP